MDARHNAYPPIPAPYLRGIRPLADSILSLLSRFDRARKSRHSLSNDEARRLRRAMRRARRRLRRAREKYEQDQGVVLRVEEPAVSLDL